MDVAPAAKEGGGDVEGLIGWGEYIIYTRNFWNHFILDLSQGFFEGKEKGGKRGSHIRGYLFFFLFFLNDVP